MAPELTTEPIGYQALAGSGIGPRANISSDAVGKEDGVAYGSGVAEDIGGPMGKKRLPVARRKSGEPGGFWIKLVSEENRKIVHCHRSEGYERLHFCRTIRSDEPPARA